MKCNETLSKWCKNKHGASKIIDMLETYQCHSASSLFSAVFVFQKSYTGNILGIGRNKSRTSYFYRSFTKTEDETEGGQGPASPPGGASQPLATHTYGETTWSTS
jgi:hypothetical protein